MERSNNMLNKSTFNFPTLLNTTKLDPKQKLRLDLNLTSKSSVTAATPRSKPLVLSITPKACIQSNERFKTTPMAEPSKPSMKNISIKPILKSEILKFPTTPQEILNFMPDLPTWCKAEMSQYKEIFYFCKSTKGVSEDFDDGKGDYKVIIGDDIFYRYEIQDVLGKGSFGQVLKVYDHLSKKTMALKIIKSRQRYSEQARIEIEILNYLKLMNNSNPSYIVNFESSFEFRRHTMLIFELLGLNLYELLKRNSFRGLSITLIKRISHQMLQSLSMLGSSHIIHCDLKPENILLSDSNLSSVKLIDFGSSCFSNQRVYTYIQSRFYRAPEIVLGVPYTTAIDIWSFGCILVELYTGIPIFPCESEKELISRVVEVLDYPPCELLNTASRKGIFFNGEGKLKDDSHCVRKQPGHRNLRGILKGAEEEFILIIERCLKWNPCDRVLPEQALRSAWFMENQEKVSMTSKKRCKISIEDITKHTPQLQKFIAHRNNTLK